MSKSEVGRQVVLTELERVLSPILSPRQPFEKVVVSLDDLDSADYEFVEHWVKVIAVSNIELAYVFACSAGQARRSLSKKGTRVWMNQCLALYDREGLFPAIKALQDIDTFKSKHTRDKYKCSLEEIKPGLDLFIRGLAGRELTVKKGVEVYTDTLYLYLPENISRYRDKEQNRSLYKAMACFLWAQNWYGTFKRQNYSSLSTEDRINGYENPNRARQYFLILENIRLLYCIQRDFPGMYRDINMLSPLRIPDDKTWKTVCKKLKQESSSVEDSFLSLDILLAMDCKLRTTDYQGVMNLGEVETILEERRGEVIKGIAELLDNGSIDKSQLAEGVEHFNASGNCEGPGEGEKEGGGEGVSEIGKLLSSLLQDVGHIDMELFDDATDSDISKGGNDGGRRGDEMQSPPPSENKVLELDEWDYLRQSYRRKWCRVHVRRTEEGDKGFKLDTEKKYPFIIAQIRKVFEAMRDQPRYANRQTDGDEIDLDAVVDTFTAKLAGEELSDRMYIRRQQSERSVAVFLLVDMSGSTKGWINLAMRESLVLFSRALNTLGDQYAIQGFSGLTRQRCEIYSVKDFEESNSDLIDARIAGIQAKDYTRMGFSIRYAIRELLKTAAKHRILLMLSDGKPDDYDGYQGEYGIQDTRKAILEAQGQGIRPYSITIDKQAQTYLPRLFGPGQFMILDSVSALPLKLSEVYRKLSA